MIRKKGIELGLLVLLLAALLLVSGKKGQKEAGGEGGYVETAGKAEESVSEDAGEEDGCCLKRMAAKCFRWPAPPKS